MTPMNRLARLHAMDAATWERHASPWSVWTRVPILPLAALVLLARETLGWWALAALAALAMWAWANPRAFAPPRSTRSWASRAVMGERVWLDRGAVPVPAHHARPVRAALALSVAGMLPLAWGIWRVEPWTALVGVALVLAGKFWFLDRMVRLFDDMAAQDPIYRAWLR